MTSPKIIAIVGATGTQGGSVARTFLTDPAWKVRALTRSKSSQKAQQLEARGAEVFEANLNDVASLEAAFKGAHVVFGVTDFWTLYGDQSMREKHKSSQPWVDRCAELERQQGKNIFDAAAKASTIERVIYSTLPHVAKLSDGKYKNAVHFDSKALAAEYAETTYPDLWSKTSLIQLGFFLTNFSLFPWARPAKNQETGVYDIKTFSPDQPFPMVDAETDTGVLVKELIANPAPVGKQLTAYRTWMSTAEYAKLWGQVVGVEARAVSGAADSFPAELANELGDTFSWAREFGMFGQKIDKSVISTKELFPSLDLGGVEDWIRKQDWASLLQQ